MGRKRARNRPRKIVLKGDPKGVNGRRRPDYPSMDSLDEMRRYEVQEDIRWGRLNKNGHPHGCGCEICGGMG